MTERTRPEPHPVHGTARRTSRIVELLDILWEQARNNIPPPYVPVSQLRVMYIVEGEGGIRMRDLTRLLSAAPPSVSRLVDRLQALGFIERLPSPDNGREVMLALTGEGREHLARIRECRDELLVQTLADMPFHQRTALAEGLAGLEEALAGNSMLLAKQESRPALISRNAAHPHKPQRDFREPYPST
ncbi:MarR family winged helix-turn-helix transcriptional regulator [Streptomyces sp. NPDC101733]|uniref:MarR family winged helix-turn-helix transcriptional regulator n=1 Tax=unclassified Streptomyces TaxID=2593676 RepID=UPI0037F38779